MTQVNLQPFVITAENTLDPSSRPVQFLISAASHRDAWRVAREVARTGRGAKLRDQKNVELLHDYPLTPGLLTVKRVLSTSQSRRGRPPKMNTRDLLALAQERRVNVPPRVQRVLNELLS